ncbi:hypothetical protein [Massilia varians]|uniref:hypothetical protein n=1 Tax=Massilia varians TaxID=457921 RepID=UPI002557B38A|nr:hypothetical protein [Massilia varians]MDK6076716.1 hypothetical protein [Massilia varians]
MRISEEAGSGMLSFYRRACTLEGGVMAIKSPSGILGARLKDWKTGRTVAGCAAPHAHHEL